MKYLALAALTLFVIPSAMPNTFRGVVHAQATPVLPEVLKKTMEYYAALTSYSDTGTMQEDGGGTGSEARFTTYFRRASRDFYFDYQLMWWRSGSSKFDGTANRTVIWMFKNQMEKFQTPPRLHEVIKAEGGGQVQAIASANYTTKGTSIMITSLLYSQAGLASTLRQIQEAQVAGFEVIDGRRCQKITGTAWAYYPSGQRTGIRPVTVWIDVETQLIRRIFEDTPPGYGSGTGVLRYTFTFDPKANPTIDDAKFQFRVPPAPASK